MIQAWFAFPLTRKPTCTRNHEPLPGTWWHAETAQLLVRQSGRGYQTQWVPYLSSTFEAGIKRWYSHLLCFLFVLISSKKVHGHHWNPFFLSFQYQQSSPQPGHGSHSKNQTEHGLQVRASYTMTFTRCPYVWNLFFLFAIHICWLFIDPGQTCLNCGIDYQGSGGRSTTIVLNNFVQRTVYSCLSNSTFMWKLLYMIEGFHMYRSKTKKPKIITLHVSKACCSFCFSPQHCSLWCATTFCVINMPHDSYMVTVPLGL